jgi:hypothetical protein
MLKKGGLGERSTRARSSAFTIGNGALMVYGASAASLRKNFGGGGMAGRRPRICMNGQHRILDNIHFSKSGDALEKFLADGLEIIFGNLYVNMPSSPTPTKRAPHSLHYRNGWCTWFVWFWGHRSAGGASAEGASEACIQDPNSTSHVRNLFPNDVPKTFSRRCSRIKKSVCMSTCHVATRTQPL